MTIRLSCPRTEHFDLKAFEEVFRHQDGQITNGPMVKRLEKRVSTYLQTEYCVAVCNATTGLTMVLRAIRARMGSPYRKEVILPAFTFGATLLAVLNAGLTPRCVDVLEDGTMDPEKLADTIGTNTLAIMPVDAFGLPADYASIVKVRDAHQAKYLPIVADSAQAFGSIWQLQGVGQQADFHVFSLSPTKLVTGGEGGLITGRTGGELARWFPEPETDLQLLRNYGFDSPHRNHRRDLILQGASARMSEFNAVAALQSLDNLNFEFTRRGHIRANYLDELRDYKFMPFVAAEARYGNNCYCVIRARNRDELPNALLANDIECRPYFYPTVPQLKLMANTLDAYTPYPVAEKLARECLAIPMHSKLTPADVERVSCVLRYHAIPTE